VKLVGQTVGCDGHDARVAKNDFVEAFGRRISLISRSNIVGQGLSEPFQFFQQIMASFCPLVAQEVQTN